VDKEGRIDGTGHAVRDTVEWLIPVLWPIDLINLPRRGPTPTLKPETRLTVLLMEDVGIPTKYEVQHQPEPISKYNYADNQTEQQAGAPIERSYPQQPVQQSYAQPAYAAPAYAQPSPTVVVVQQPAPVVIQQQPAVVHAPVVYPYPPPPPGYYYPGYYRVR
jgi:hypothetical protein